MDVVHQVLQVGVHTRLSINRCLLIGQQVIKLDDSDRNSLELLCFEHDLLEDWVLDHLVCNYGSKMTCLCDIPPVVAVQRSIQVVTKALSTQREKVDEHKNVEYQDSYKRALDQKEELDRCTETYFKYLEKFLLL